MTARYSADVSMHLQVNGFSLKVINAWKNFCVLETPIDHDPIAAVFVVAVDGKEWRKNVLLETGLSREKLLVEYKVI